MTERLKLLSLFSGCGGMDLGFEGGFSAFSQSIPQTEEFVEKELDNSFVKLKETRFQITFANDILPSAYRLWTHNFSKLFGYKKSLFHEESIVDIVKRAEIGSFEFPNNIDIVIGGFPCQDFSIAGKRLGFSSNKSHKGGIIQEDNTSNGESRGTLYSWMKKVIEITKPKMFIAENVKGLTNLGNALYIIQKDFSSAADDGYFVFPPRVLHAADYGIPQSRERVFFIGVRKSALRANVRKALINGYLSKDLSPYPLPTHTYTTYKSDLLPMVSLRSIFKDLDEPYKTKDISQKHYSKAKYMGSHCQGQKEINLDDIGPTIRAEHHGNIEFRRLSRENGGQYYDELEKGFIQRRLTLRECALIQSFPYEFDVVIPSQIKNKKFFLSPSDGYKLIGNAVPPLLAYHIAKRVESLWDIYFNN